MRTAILGLLASAALLLPCESVRAQVWVQQQRNPWTGNIHTQQTVRNPWTGQVAVQNTVHNPWTGGVATNVVQRNPWAGPWGGPVAVNPWTGRVGRFPPPHRRWW